MVFEIVGAAFLVAFGFVAIYFSAESDARDAKMLIILVLGLIMIVMGGWIIVTRISLATLLAKIAGIIFAFLGFFMIWGFPDAGEYQKEGMAKTGIFLGILFFIIGLYLLLFFV